MNPTHDSESSDLLREGRTRCRRRFSEPGSGPRRTSEAVRRVRAMREERVRKVYAQLEDAISANEQGERAGTRERIGHPRAKIDFKAEIARLKNLRRQARVRFIITLLSVVASALLQAYAMKAFVQPSNLLSSGFTGLAILIDRITSLFGVSFPTFAGMIALNIPVAIISWNSISKRFVVFSMIQVLLASFFLRALSFQPILHDTILTVVFGGFLYGLAIAIALVGGASTAGTDFISLMVSNKIGKGIWGFIFAGNCVVLVIFGSMFGWTAAAYSIIFQFISTKTIELFYHRYDRVTLQIITTKPDEVLESYCKKYHHGSSCFEGIGGYSRETYWLINTVVSSYEVNDIVALVRIVDGGAVVNAFRTENFFGNFYRDQPN
ncbi:YitT family protein [Collinsella aerofaciens]|uniref:Putative BCR, YitT family n=1 Tax=Collinsella aerofaciens TaxID=74426 RepID=A0A5K1ID02_9ACTN|nr:YitT family protein [Collinsella aerofaciens]VWL63490.1 putative BCR, YitT family [Collinsella aerofaciens]VWM01848.1 putative BCR, YitT family [Collinsella aerofaciens]VWM04601.1 putative BCR, YitT family [Collinsella aerofaciens]